MHELTLDSLSGLYGKDDARAVGRSEGAGQAAKFRCKSLSVSQIRLLRVGGTEPPHWLQVRARVCYFDSRVSSLKQPAFARA